MRRLGVLISAVCLATTMVADVARAQEVDPTLAPLDAGAPLPQDPRLVTRTLENGLRVLALRHPSPPGRVLIWARVDVGSLDEGEDELGCARLAEEASLAGVRAGEWQAALDRLARRGLNPDEAFGGRTRQDQTIFWLALPDADGDALDAGLSLLGRVVFDATLGKGEVERARELALGALRAKGGAEARARMQWLPELGGDSLIGRRPADGDEASVRAASAGGVLAFRARWYTPTNTTVLIVGDIDPEQATRAVSRWYGTLAARATPVRQARCSAYPEERRAAIGSDPELGGSEVALVSIAPPSGPVRTQGDLRKFLLEQTAMRALDGRINAAIAEGRLEAIDQGVFVADLYGAMRVAQVAATAPADGWRDALAGLCAETQRIREFGFTRTETDEAIARMLTILDEYAEVEASLPSSEVMRWLNYNDAAGHVWMTMQAELGLARRILIGVRAEELTRELREMMPEGAETVVVTAPEGAIEKREVLAVVDGAMEGPLDPVAEPAPPTALTPRLPDAGAVEEITAHPPSGVWSAWLSNNVRVHHRRVPGSEGRVLVRATLGDVDGRTGEDELASACAEAWARPAVEGISSVQVRRLLADARVSVSGWGDAGGLVLQIEASPRDMVLAFELAHRLLLDPSLEGPALERWRRARLMELEKTSHDPVGRLDDGLAALASPRVELDEGGDGRANEVGAITLEGARAWLGELVASAPLEVSIVGDISRTDAFELSERYLGSLPRRARVSASSGSDDEAGSRLRRVENVETRTPVAGVLSALRGGAMSETPEGGRLAVAARVLQSRLNATLREQRRLVSSVRCEVHSGAGGLGEDVLSVRTTCEPEHSDEVAELIERAIEALSTKPASADEVSAAASQVAGEYRDALATPEFWAETLDSLDRRGLSLDDLAGALDARAACMPQDVLGAMQTCRGSALWVTLITRPAP
ncbi:MAG: insulinase family protein [Phycisphaerales bacterium]